LIVDADAVLALAIALERFQPVAGWDAEVVERRSRLELGEFAEGGLQDVRREFGWFLAEPEPMGRPAGEGGDYGVGRLCTLSVHGVKGVMHVVRA